MPFSILHFSDLHLDAAFATSYLPANVARRCREQLRQSLRRLVDLAKERRVEAVTIAGDLFERERLTNDTAAFLMSELERLAPIPVFIAPGNHDAADAASLYQRGVWPENVQIALRPNLMEWRLSPDYSLWSAGHLTPSERQNFLNGFMPSPGATRVHLLLLHASVAPSHFNNARAHAPLTLTDIAEAGFSLALLGHYHTARILRDKDVAAVYPGSLEPLGFQETGEHGAAWIQLEPGKPPTIELVPLATLRFEIIEVAVDDCEQREQLIDKVIATAGQRNLDAAFTRLKLTGQAPSSLHLNLEQLAGRLEKHFAHVHIENQTRPAIDLQELAAEPTARGEFVRDVLNRMKREPDRQALYDEVLDYALQAFEREEITLR